MAPPRLDPDAIPAGTRVGDFRVQRVVGRGSFGTVYEALRDADGVRVALKVMSGRVLDPTGGGDRFKREAELARRLTHPAIVRVLDAGIDGGLLFTALELLEGSTLEEELLRGPMPLRRVIQLTSEVLAGLEEAHRLSVIHRDIKPANLFLCRASGGGETIKILDFGVAKSINPNTAAGLTRDGMSLGTPAYMAPEQLAGLDVGPATDLFALGLVVAEMLTGRFVYGAASEPIAILQERLSGARPPIPPEVTSSPLGAIVEAATTPDPAHRTASAAQMRQALVQVLAGLPPEQAPAPRAEQALPVPGQGHATPSALAPGAVASKPRSMALPAALGGGLLLLAAAAGGYLLLGGGGVNAATGSPGGGESPTTGLAAAPTAFVPLPLAVGQWFRIRSTTEGLPPALVEYRLVDQRPGGAWVMEVESESGGQKSINEMVLTFGDRTKLDGVALKSARVKAGGRIIDLPVAATGPILQELRQRLQLPPFDPARRADVTVEAGTFPACFVRDVKETIVGRQLVQTSYSHASVPINALVKSEGTLDGKPSRLELVAFGVTGAKRAF